MRACSVPFHRQARPRRRLGHVVRRGAAACAFALPLLLVGAGPARALPPDVAAGLSRGIDRLLDMELDRAAAEARALEQMPDGEAVGAFLAAFVPVTRALETEDPSAELDQFLAALRPVLERVQALEAKRPRDPEAKLLAGMVWGAKAMADGSRRNILAAYTAIKEAHRGFTEALALQPDLYDAYYGLGLYDLSLSQLSRLLRSAASLVLPSGEPDRALEKLRLAAERGTFTRPLAQMALFHHLANAEQRYADAAPLGQALADRYPNNPDLYFPLAVCYSETGRYEEALRVARRVGARIEAGTPPFTRAMLPRYYQLMGKVYMDMGEDAAALRFFRQAVDQGNKPYAWVTAWALTRAGMIYDLHGDRQEAIRHYRQALEVDTESLAKDYAQDYLAAPYRRTAPRPRRGTP